MWLWQNIEYNSFTKSLTALVKGDFINSKKMLEIHFLKNEFLAKLLSLLKRENLRTKTEESIKQFLLLLWQNDLIGGIVWKNLEI